jgi:DNA-binding transcriptional ArsR family regulator
MTMSEGDEQSFGWDVLVPRIVHPLKVAIVEGLQWLGQPLSATDLTRLFDVEDFDLSSVSYHMTQLAKAGALEKVRQRQVRGSIEKFYFFPPQAKFTITAEQRDALYEEIAVRFQAIDDIWLAICAENYDAAQRLGREYADDLRLITDGLGWGEGSGEAVELSAPADVLRRALRRLRAAALGVDAFQEQERAEVREVEERNRLVVEACDGVLASLEGDR